MLLFGYAIAIGIAQKNELIGRFHRSAQSLEHQLGHEVFDHTAIERSRAIALRDQNIAIGHGVDHTRMIEPFGETVDHKTISGLRGLPLAPAGNLDSAERRDGFGVGFGKHRICAARLLQRQCRLGAAQSPPEEEGDEKEKHRKRDEDFLEHAHICGR